MAPPPRDHTPGSIAPLTTFLILLVRLYQLALSPYLPSACRFYPSCSHFALQALEIHGAWRGMRMTTRRLLRCQPLCRGGYDPVP